MKKRFLCRALCLCFAAALALAFASTALASSSYAPANAAYYVATEDVNIRSGPSAKYPVIGTLKKGAVVYGLGSSGAWRQIVVNPSNVSAYVSESYLKAYDKLDASSVVSYPACSAPLYDYGPGTVPGRVFAYNYPGYYPYAYPWGWYYPSYYPWYGCNPCCR